MLWSRKSRVRELLLLRVARNYFRSSDITTLWPIFQALLLAVTASMDESINAETYVWKFFSCGLVKTSSK
jgi:hypothetical protein